MFLLPGVPAALTAVLAQFAAGLAAAGVPPPYAPAYAAHQWWACDMWAPDPGPQLELCAWAAGAGVPVPVADEAAAGMLLAHLLGNASNADFQCVLGFAWVECSPGRLDSGIHQTKILRTLSPPTSLRGSDPSARMFVLTLALSPPEYAAHLLGLPVDAATAVQAYVRHVGRTIVGVGLATGVLGPPLGPSSGGLVVSRTVRQWLEGAGGVGMKVGVRRGSVAGSRLLTTYPSHPHLQAGSTPCWPSACPAVPPTRPPTSARRSRFRRKMRPRLCSASRWLPSPGPTIHCWPPSI